MAKSIQIIPLWMPRILTDNRIQIQGIKFYKKKDYERHKKRLFHFNSFRRWGNVAWAEVLPDIMLPYHRMSSDRPWHLVVGAVPPEYFLQDFPADEWSQVDELQSSTDPYTTPLVIA